MLHEVKEEADARSCSAIISDHYKQATLFRKIEGYKVPLIANSASSREMIALALETQERNILAECLRRVSRPVKPVFAASDGICQERTLIGAEKVDLTKFPIILQHEYDGAPYISAGVVVAKDPETQDYNIGIYRLMFRKKNELGINITAPHRLRWFYQKALDKGKPLEVAVVLGLHAIDLLASVTTVPEGQDELSVWGGLRKNSVRMVPCKTIDLHVPSHAEIVLEAAMEPIGWVEPEGPYGEFPGTYSGMRKNPVLKVKAITSRREPIYQSATHGGRHLGYTDFFVLIPQIEVSIYQVLKHAGIDVKAVRVLPNSAGMVCYASISPRVRGDSMNALHLALVGSKQNFPKYCILVDSDIDIFNDDEVIWALATRTQPAEDIIVLEGLRIPSSSDPSLVGPPYSLSKLGIDATIPLESKRSRFEFSRPPRRVPKTKTRFPERKTHQLEGEMLNLMTKSGPMFFYEVMKGFPRDDYRSILLAWSRLRESDSIRQADDGRYNLK
jgi:UbiD family decarboxylase